MKNHAVKKMILIRFKKKKHHKLSYMDNANKIWKIGLFHISQNNDNIQENLCSKYLSSVWRKVHTKKPGGVFF